MKKTTLILMIVFTAITVKAEFFPEGDGSEENPFRIYKLEHLEEIKHWAQEDYLHFKLEASIDAEGVFKTLPDFYGTFDGNHHVLYLDEPFIDANYGMVKNLGVIVEVDGSRYNTHYGNYGAIACSNMYSGLISGCFVAGTIINMGGENVGGIAGENQLTGTIYNCRSYVYIQSNGENIGGIVGITALGYKDGEENGGIIRCYTHGTLIGERNVGGICGKMERTDYPLIECRAYVMAYGEENVGSLIGWTENNLELTNCYAHGVVKGNNYIGGLAGRLGGELYLNASPLLYSAVTVDSRSMGEYDAGLITGEAAWIPPMPVEHRTLIDMDINPYLDENFINGNGDYSNVHGIELHGTEYIMSLPYWSYYEGRPEYPGYPVLPWNQELDWWQDYYSVESFLMDLDPFLLNRLVKWECFDLNEYTIWTDVVRSGKWRNMEYCSLFNLPEEEIPCFEGRGTAQHPYLIGTPEQLDCMIDYMLENIGTDEHFRITADMDMFDYLFQNYPTTGWCGNELPAFNGYLHGGGHVISGIWMNHPDANTVGGLLAGTTANAVIDSLGITYHSRGITAYGETGGLVGRNRGTIVSCFTLGGTIVAMNDINGTGGLVGVNEGTIQDSYSTCNVLSYGSGSNHVGGLVGYNNMGTIMYTYAAGRIMTASSAAAVGGLVGSNNNGTCRFSYYDLQTTNQQTGIGYDNRSENRYVYGNTTAEMKEEMYVDLLDLYTIWRLTPGYYPALRWQTPETEPFRLIITHELAEEIENTLSGVRIYPNPTDGILYIETAEENPEISLYDLNGTLIISTTDTTLDLSGCPKGMYILKVNGQMEKVIKK